MESWLPARDLLDRRGMRRPRDLVHLIRSFGDEIRPARPPWALLRGLAALLAPFAR
jgi:hypothetical protein